ncbi:hypothetical protein J3A83DRAFT_3157760 [Scleroderma citrinum]
MSVGEELDNSDVPSARMEQLWMDIKMFAQNKEDEREVKHVLQEEEKHSRNAVEKGGEEGEGPTTTLTANCESQPQPLHYKHQIRSTTKQPRLPSHRGISKSKSRAVNIKLGTKIPVPLVHVAVPSNNIHIGTAGVTKTNRHYRTDSEDKHISAQEHKWKQDLSQKYDKHRHGQDQEPNNVKLPKPIGFDEGPHTLAILGTTAAATTGTTGTGVVARQRSVSPPPPLSPVHPASQTIDTDTDTDLRRSEQALPIWPVKLDTLPISTEPDSVLDSINPNPNLNPAPQRTTSTKSIAKANRTRITHQSLTARVRDSDANARHHLDNRDIDDEHDCGDLRDAIRSKLGIMRTSIGTSTGIGGDSADYIVSSNRQALMRATIGISHSKSKPSEHVSEDPPSSAPEATTTTVFASVKTPTASETTHVKNQSDSDVIDVLRSPAASPDPRPAPAPSLPPATLSYLPAVLGLSSPSDPQPLPPQILAPPSRSSPSPPPHVPTSHLESAEHEAFRAYVPPVGVVPNYDRGVDVDVGVPSTMTDANTSTHMAAARTTTTTKAMPVRRDCLGHRPQHGHNQGEIPPIKRGTKRPIVNVDIDTDADAMADSDNDPGNPDLGPSEDHGCSDGHDRRDEYGHGHGRPPPSDARPLKKGRVHVEGSSPVSEWERTRRVGNGSILVTAPTVPAPTGTGARTGRPTLPTARTKYTPNPTLPLPTFPSPSASGARGGAPGSGVLPYLTHLRETHRKIGIGNGGRGVTVSEAGGERAGRLKSASGSRSGKYMGSSQVRPRLHARPKTRAKSGQHSSMSVRTDLHGDNGLKRRPPEVLLHNATTANAVPPLPPPPSSSSILSLIKPVAFTFRVDARLEARKADVHKLLAASEPAQSQTQHETRLAPLYDSHHGEAWLRLRKDNATNTLAATTATTAVPFVLCTEQRAKDRAKFDAMVRQKEEEMARAREEARRKAEEEEEREIREIRRRAVPKANEVPEWYARMPKRKRVECEGGDVDEVER